MSLSIHFDPISTSLRSHFEFTSNSLSIHLDSILIALRCHSDFTSISPSTSLSTHFEFISISFRFLIDSPSVWCRFHFCFTSFSLIPRFHIDPTSISLRSTTQKGQTLLTHSSERHRRKGGRRHVRTNSTKQPDHAHALSNDQNETKRFPCWARTPPPPHLRSSEKYANELIDHSNNYLINY